VGSLSNAHSEKPVEVNYQYTTFSESDSFTNGLFSYEIIPMNPQSSIAFGPAAGKWQFNLFRFESIEV
jgi:hypothetical protein